MKSSCVKKMEVPEQKTSAITERRVFRSEELFKDDREVVILHGEAKYRLQITKAGKLILNK